MEMPHRRHKFVSLFVLFTSKHTYFCMKCIHNSIYIIKCHICEVLNSYLIQYISTRVQRDKKGRRTAFTKTRILGGGWCLDGAEDVRMYV